MARIIILERQGLGSIDRSYRVAFWLDVPEPRRRYYADPNARSVFKDATDDDLAAIRAGAVIEQVETLIAPQGASDEQAFGMLVGSLQRRQAELVERNPFDNYGTFWDGSAWHRVTVA